MPETLVDAAGTLTESLEKQLERVNKDIEAVERKKLITLVSPGGPDRVLYIKPFDLRGKDPEEEIEIIENYVMETKWDNGFAQHVVAKRGTGRFEKRGPKGLFGYTYKIETHRPDGEKEWEELKRVLDTHCSRLSRVPEPAAYHKDVNELGHLDLRNVTLKQEDVPVALLENYEPLSGLLTERKVLEDKIKARKSTEGPVDRKK